MRSPSARSAARCASRARNDTSAPATASHPPKSAGASRADDRDTLRVLPFLRKMKGRVGAFARPSRSRLDLNQRAEPTGTIARGANPPIEGGVGRKAHAHRMTKLMRMKSEVAEWQR
jgi:hypothetical protein